MVLATITNTTFYEHIMNIFQTYGSFGPLIAIGVPFIDAFFPFLPLFVFVFANAASFGFWTGFFYSWFGTSMGAVLFFIVVRKYGQTRFFSFLNTHPKIKKTIDRIEHLGFGPIFLLLSFPFTPSFLINIVAALSKMKVFQFILALILGKLVMVGSMTYIGYDLKSFFQYPSKTIFMLAIIALMWFVGKIVEKNLGLQKDEKLEGNGLKRKWGEKKKRRSNG
jgi:uncharacterized membrane protein YdjX (TVP38/TMEM64 family)